MLKKERRVNTELFKRVVKSGQTFSFGSLYMKIIKISGKTQLAFSVPKSVEKNAATRNKLKRKGMAQIEGVVNQTKDGFGGVIFLKNTKTTTKQEDVERLLQIGGLIENNHQ